MRLGVSRYSGVNARHRRYAVAKMTVVHCAIVSILFSSVLSVSSKVPGDAARQESQTAFFGEDVHMALAGRGGEVAALPEANASGEAHSRLPPPGRLVLQDVREEDEDCAVETVVKYGDTYHFPLSNIQGPITLEFRPSPPQPNGSLLLENPEGPEGPADPEGPVLVLFNQTAVAGGYAGRLRVSDRKVVLHGVTVADEGSFTVLDRDGKVHGRNCLNVIKHEDFIQLRYGETLRLDLHQPPSRVSVSYTPSRDQRARPVLERGVLAAPQDPLLEGRLSLEGSRLLLRKASVADRGLFRVTDRGGFTVADAHLQVDAFKLSNLYVVILSLLGLIALLLLLCLLSCFYKVHRRNQKNRKLLLLAQQAGQGDGQAFRQVVQDAYTRFTEESQMQSSWEENPTESTEVTIKGLEVSRPGHYQALPSYKEALEMSDSGAECPSLALPLDSDAEGPPTFASNHLLLDDCSPIGRYGADGVLSESTEAPPDPDPSDLATPDSAPAASAAVQSPVSAMSASPASNARSHATENGEGAAATPNGSLRGIASPGATSPLGEGEAATVAEGEGGSGAPGGGGQGAGSQST